MNASNYFKRDIIQDIEKLRLENLRLAVEIPISCKLENIVNIDLICNYLIPLRIAKF